ncbi:condensation domain-containing protein [Bacillus thuringiensis]
MQGENIIYNTPQILEVNGYLDLNRLEKAFQKLIQRHDILRTHFIMENGTPIQKITDSIEFLLEFEVINKELDIQQLLNEFVEPFNLSESPLLRAKVVQITENKSILIIDIHHIICDGVSKKTLLGDLSKFYEGKYLATPEIQYKDYSVWENNRNCLDKRIIG